MNRKSTSLALLFSFIVSLTPASAQQPTASPQPAQQPANDEEVVRITSNLVQIDAVVTDKKGNQVTSLTADDFEIYQDGKPQTITNFSYVSTTPNAPANPPPAARTASADKLAPPVPPARIRPEQVRRTMAIVVDDLGLSFQSTAYVRQALKKYIDEQMQPGDLVAIIRTSAGVGALQQFTTDKRQLYAAIERVRWYPVGRVGVSAFAPLESNNLNGLGSQGSDAGTSNQIGADMESAAQRLDQFREDLFAVGTLGALNYVIRGLKELPGRKSVVLFSEGFRVTTPIQSYGNPSSDRSNTPLSSQFREINPRIFEALRRLIDLALRSSVVIYTIDARGLVYTGLTAADDVSGMNQEQIQSAVNARNDLLFETQSTLQYLADETGGLAIRNNNDLASGIRRALDDQQGFYLIGYRPDEKTFEPKDRNFHKWTVKVKNHPELRVRSRRGFYGVTETEARPVRRTRGEQLFAALTSPFGTDGVNLKLTSLFSNAAKTGSFMRSFLYINARDLTFTDEADGWHKTTIDVMAITFGDNGAAINQVNRTETVRAKDAAYQTILKNGLIYTINVPLKKPGAYQLRVALRDAASQRIGAASQFIEAPDLKKNHLALSGILLAGESQQKADVSKTAPAQTNAAASQFDEKEGAATDEQMDVDAQATAAVRRFHPGMTLDYGYLVFDAQTDRATHHPRLTTQIRLFRDGRLVYTSKPVSFNLAAANSANNLDMQRLPVSGRFQLGAQMPAGEYVLQVIVTDELAKEKYRTATQWIDFEVVK
jgi:VWFA-related protein